MPESNDLKPYKVKADMYIKDKKKSLQLLDQALQKAADHKRRLGKTWEKLQLLLGVFRDWINGSYREIPTRSLVMIVLGIVYFVSPIDGIFDYIPFGGFVDDAAVLGYVLSQVGADLEKYKLWKERVDLEKDPL
ncbi:YkvA family protein [Desulfosporosinus orientis]|nr:YkvA family protein [Desulfosporosinus orientis]